ncbi:MAG: beta/gamma crystallin family protein [Methylobacterium sp.]|uniref:beta/gamma crystallin-related protein n=1 Tax=Methylobacterium sp. TaxID=409 RepID=UPI00258BF85B|nr:beta/gamma crystallin-related protein [Methylobacterium sp.]MBY0300052.1 beta/gamma crystallin family protein [Methylobacterium sp.]
MVANLYIYDEKNCTGESKQFTKDVPDLRALRHKLGNWNDEAVSFDIQGGQWIFCEDVDYGGRRIGPLGKGAKGNLEDYGIPANWISSIKKHSD